MNLITKKTQNKMGIVKDTFCTIQRLRMEALSGTVEREERQDQLFVKYDLGEDKKRFYQLLAQKREFYKRRGRENKEAYKAEFKKLKEEIKALEAKLSKETKKGRRLY